MRTSLDATRRRRGGLNPDHMIPKLALEDMNKKGGGERRRSSVFKGMVALRSTRQEGESGAEAGEGN